jgi:Tfp pilus assembly protein PilW
MVTWKNEAGLTAIELLFAAAISVGVLGASATLASQMQSRYNLESELAEARQEGGYALMLIGRYLRGAGNNPFSLLVTSCPVAGTPVAAIRIDPDGDGIDDDIRLQSDVSPPNGRIGGLGGGCTEAGEDVTISHDAAASTITVRDNNLDASAVARTDGIITSLRFSYRDLNHAVTAVAANVAFVEVTVIGRTRTVAAHLGTQATHVVSTEVRMRNR